MTATTQPCTHGLVQQNKFGLDTSEDGLQICRGCGRPTRDSLIQRSLDPTRRDGLTCPNPSCNQSGTTTQDRFCGWCGNATVGLATLQNTRVCQKADCSRTGVATENSFCGACGNQTIEVPRSSARVTDMGRGVAHPQSARPGGVAAADQPGVGSTVVITLLFGLFGLIPAFLNSDRARQSGQPTNRYWAAFWWSILASVVAWILIWIILAAAIASNANSGYGG